MEGLVSDALEDTICELRVDPKEENIEFTLKRAWGKEGISFEITENELSAYLDSEDEELTAKQFLKDHLKE